MPEVPLYSTRYREYSIAFSPRGARGRKIMMFQARTLVVKYIAPRVLDGDTIELFQRGIYYRERLRAYVYCQASSHMGRAPVGTSWVVVAGVLTGVDFIPLKLLRVTE